jgi:hypothetical protein
MQIARRIAWIAVLSFCCAVGSIHADGPQTGTLEGRVLDAQGAPLPGVTVNLTGPQGGTSTVTGDDGAFRFGLLVGGDYTVGATLEGLGSTEVKVVLGSGTRERIELKLGGAQAETITVTSEAPLINKFETSSSATIESEVSSNLSFIARNVQSSVEVLPGVVHTAQSRLQAGIQASVNGGQWQESAGFVDGVDTSFARRGGASRIFLPVSSLTETRMETGFTAEYGRVVAGVTNSTIKSGTNQFHGDFLYIPQSEKWRAEFEELDIDRDDDIKDSYETSLGGPIVRDKAWFFASYGRINSNEGDQLANGDHVDVGFDTEAMILKLNFQPSAKHQLQFTGVDAPTDKIQIAQTSGDQFTPCDCALSESLATLTWSFAVTQSSFLETKVATQEDDLDRAALVSHAIAPGVTLPGSNALVSENPAGNNFPYQDQGSGLRYNAIAQGAGLGTLDTGREQANASLSLFRGKHELKFGADYQDVSQETFNFIGVLFRGSGYNPALPGGFVTPADKRVFDPTEPVETTAEVLSAYAQDRFDVTDRFVLYVGVRMDDQAFDNDAGAEVNSSTDFAPRLGATFDLDGEGTMLLKANAGRYYQVSGQDIFNREYATKPNGTNQFTQIRWNTQTQRYDGQRQSTVPVLNFNPGTFDPYYKDEVGLGFEWQFVPAWAFEVRGSWWEVDDTFWSTDQWNAAGQVVRDVRNWDDGFREYEALQLQLNRAMRNNWTLRTNYTFGENNGNNFGAGDGTIDDDDLFEALGGVERNTTNTTFNTAHREGRGNTSRDHNLNVVGLKIFPVGAKNNIGLGGYFGFRSGEYWGLRPNIVATRAGTTQTINTTAYREDRDAQQMEDTYTLNLTGYWQFPIKGIVSGRLGVEAVNVTNEQEVISINIASGQPDAGKVAYQAPREYRLQVGITF